MTKQNMSTKIPWARKHATKYKGRTYSTYHVLVTQSGMRDHEHEELCWQEEIMLPVIAASPADAIYHVQDELLPHLSRPTEFETRGPKGGITYRFLGYEGLIGRQLFTGCQHAPEQLTLKARAA